MQTHIDDMLRLLDSPQPAIVARGLQLIGQHMLPLEQLDRLYEAGNSEVRVAVLKYLARNLPPGHISITHKALSDSSNSVMLAAVQHLITFPNTSTAPILETLLKNPEFPRKDLLIRALESCNDGRALAVLLPIVKDANHPCRMLASDTIGRMDGQPIIYELLYLLASEDEMTSFMASIALAGVRDAEIIEPVLTAIDQWWSTATSRIPFEAAHLLDKFHDPRIRDELLRLLTSKPNLPNQYGNLARSSAIHVLGNYSEPQVISYFTWLLQNGDQWDRYAVTYAFTKMKSTEAVDALMANILYENDPSILANYSYAFAVLGDKRAVPVLEALLERVDTQIRNTIETNLRSLNPPPSKTKRSNLLMALKRRLYASR
ncbi:MAG: hypothetical protein GC179_09805 [Anaerolineaceae bacterium]|nr:hypothetical protein [Anaerolineaceae bacterium]